MIYRYISISMALWHHRFTDSNQQKMTASYTPNMYLINYTYITTSKISIHTFLYFNMKDTQLHNPLSLMKDIHNILILHVRKSNSLPIQPIYVHLYNHLSNKNLIQWLSITSTLFSNNGFLTSIKYMDSIIMINLPSKMGEGCLV